MNQRLVLYTYRCVACGHNGEERLRGDSHEGAESACTTCGAPVTLEWDSGVTFEKANIVVRGDPPVRSK